MGLLVAAVCALGLCWCGGATQDREVQRSFQEQLKNLKEEVHVMQGNIDDRFHSLELSLKEELTTTFTPELTQRLLEQAARDVVSDGAIEEVVSGRVLKEISTLKARVIQLERNIRELSYRLKDQEKEQDKYGDFLMKLREEFDNRFQGLRKHRNVTLNELSAVMKGNVGLRQDLVALNTSCRTAQGMSDYGGDTTSMPLTHTEVTTPSTTSGPVQVQRTRMLAVPNRIKRTPAKEVQLGSKTVESLPSLNLKDVWSIAYVVRLRQVLLATHYRAQITSYHLDTKETRVVKGRVVVNGMGVDEGRQLVFLSIRRPGVSISRMSTEGHDFRNVVSVKWMPYSIAVDAQRTVMYVACTTRLVSVSYEGALQVVYTGDYMYSASWDPFASAVYFNHFKSVMRMSPVGNETTHVYELDYIASNAIFNNGSIYVGSYCSRFVGAVRLDGDNNATGYQTLLELQFTYYMNICLLP